MRERRLEGGFVGRADERERLLHYADDPMTGAVLLSGPTGVGCSRLAEQAMHDLTERGWRGFGLSPTESSGRIRFAAFSELIPDVLDLLADLDTSAGELAVLRGLEDALELELGPPVVVVIDDVASMDQASCELLVHFARNRRLFVIASESYGPALDEAHDRLAPARVVEIAVPPLDQATTAALAAHELGGPVGAGLVRELATRTLGFPLFVLELLEAGTASGRIRTVGGVYQLAGHLDLSVELGRQLVHRLGSVGSAEREVLEVLAVAGELGVADLAGIVGHDEVLEGMEQRGLVEIRRDRRRLRAGLPHPLVREAIRSSMAELTDRRRHRELAELLSSGSRRRSDDRIVHAIAARGAGHAVEVDHLVAAAREALRLDRVRDAETLASAAFGVTETAETRSVLAEALIRQGRFIEADGLLAAPPWDSDAEWEGMRYAILRSSNRLWGFRDSDGALEIDRECRDRLRDADAIDRVLAHEAWVLHCSGRSTAAVALTDPLVEAVHPDVRFAVGSVRAPALVQVGRIQEGRDLAQRAWDEGWGADTPWGSHGQNLIALGFAHLYLADFDAARFIAAAAIDACRARSEITPMLFFLDLAGWTELLAGRLDEAATHFEEALQIAADLAVAASLRAALAGLTIARAQAGDAAGASRSWARLLDIPVAPSPRAGIEVELARAWHTAVTGDPARAADVVRDVGRVCVDLELPVYAALYGLDIVRLGYVTPADAERIATAAAATDSSFLGAVGRLAIAAAERDPAALDEAALELGDRGAVLFAAEAAALAADLWSRDRDQRAAAASQRMAETYRAEAPAARTPLLVRAPATDPLTRREREIAGLAAAGVANAEIADRLYLSVRTVETHLRRIYRKLGVSGRRELADVLA